MNSEDFLGELHAKSYDREIDENESIWRSLPLFTVAFGFAAAILNYLAGFVRLDLQPWPIVSMILVMLPALAFAWAFRWFWDVIRIRTYRYIAPDKQISRYAVELRGFYGLASRSEDQIETDVLKALKEFCYKEFAESASQNQANNQARAKARSLVAFWLTSGFALAFLSTAIILSHEKLYGTNTTVEERSVLRDSRASEGRSFDQSPTTSSASSAVRPGRRGESVSKGEKLLSKGQQQPPTQRPPVETPQRPAPPEPVYVQKDGNGPIEKR